MTAHNRSPEPRRGDDIVMRWLASKTVRWMIGGGVVTLGACVWTIAIWVNNREHTERELRQQNEFTVARLEGLQQGLNAQTEATRQLASAVDSLRITLTIQMRR